MSLPEGSEGFGLDQGSQGWCNGWATSCRFHEDKILPCLFGCVGERDDLRHYLVCLHLFTLWSFLSNMSVSELPLIRWGLIDPCTSNLNATACASPAIMRSGGISKQSNSFLNITNKNYHRRNSAAPGVSLLILSKLRLESLVYIHVSSHSKVFWISCMCTIQESVPHCLQSQGWRWSVWMEPPVIH